MHGLRGSFYECSLSSSSSFSFRYLVGVKNSREENPLLYIVAKPNNGFLGSV